MSRRIRDPKIHWCDWNCRYFDHHMRDSYTNAPGLVTCRTCKRHVERMQRLGVLTSLPPDGPAGQIVDDENHAGGAAGEDNR